jgi:hypothetical protein
MKYVERELRTSGNADRISYYHAHWTRDGAPLLDLLGAVIDHVEAFSTGGVDHIDNLATACNKCNGRKSAATLDQWGERPMDRPVKGKYGESSELGWAIGAIRNAGATQSCNAHCRRKGLASSIDAIVVGYVAGQSDLSSVLCFNFGG